MLGIDEERIPRENSWAYDQIIEGILAGKIKGLWVIATNPAHSWINQVDAREILGRLDFLVVQDMYATHRDRAAGRPRAAGRGVGREGRHVHQFRAAASAWSRRWRARPGRRWPTSTSSS